MSERYIPKKIPDGASDAEREMWEVYLPEPLGQVNWREKNLKGDHYCGYPDKCKEFPYGFARGFNNAKCARCGFRIVKNVPEKSSGEDPSG